MAGLVLEPFGVLDRGLQAAEVAHEIALAAGRLPCADADELLDHHGAVEELADLLVVGEARRVHVDGVELGERRLAVVEVVGGQRRADVDPLATSDRLLELPLGGEFDDRRLGVGLGRTRQSIEQPGDPDQGRATRGHPLPVCFEYKNSFMVSRNVVVLSSDCVG
jgi:hypothetical protein